MGFFTWLWCARPPAHTYIAFYAKMEPTGIEEYHKSVTNQIRSDWSVWECEFACAVAVKLLHYPERACAACVAHSRRHAHKCTDAITEYGERPHGATQPHVSFAYGRRHSDARVSRQIRISHSAAQRGDTQPYVGGVCAWIFVASRTRHSFVAVFVVCLPLNPNQPWAHAAQTNQPTNQPARTGGVSFVCSFVVFMYFPHGMLSCRVLVFVMPYKQ